MQKNKLKELIALVEQSGVNEIEISSWFGRKIRITKGSNSVFAAPQPPAIAVPSAVPVAASETPPAVEKSRHHTITAPIVGTYYAASSPDAAPFLKVGDKLTEGQTICIIEAMKIMNEIESEISGTVVEILVENSNPVEFNQALVLIDPS